MFLGGTGVSADPAISTRKRVKWKDDNVDGVIGRYSWKKLVNSQKQDRIRNGLR